MPLIPSCGTKSPDRAGLAFTRYVGPERSFVWVADGDGSNARQLVAGGYTGTLSPDGRWVAYYVSDKKGQSLPNLLVRAVAGGEPRSLGKVGEYAWSPDSTRLAVSEGRALLLVNVWSGERRELARAEVYDGGLSFAPRGKALAFARANGKVGREYRSDIFTVRLSDLEVTQLTHDGHSDDPVWGREWIVYRSFHIDGDWSIGRLRLMRPDGSGKRPFARGDERVGRAQMGLEPLELSEDGKRLLACAAAEFSCPPVTFSVPDGKEYKLGLASRELVFDVGPFDGPAGHRV
jgi:hypothetical protein